MSLVISHSLVVPLQAEFFALEGLSQLVKTIDRIKINLNQNLEIQGIVLTMFDKFKKSLKKIAKNTDLKDLAKKGGKMGQRARLAKTLRKLKESLE